jgi:hypothetical protein
MSRPFPLLLLSLAFWPPSVLAAPPNDEPRFLDPIDVVVPPIASDKSVKYDYDIVYCRAKRAGDTTHKRFYTEIATPVYEQPGVDLMLLHPDGTEEVLLAADDETAVTDPVVSFDGQWIYYAFFHDLSKGGQHDVPPGGSDLYKINVKSRQVIQLTTQSYTPNTGAADWCSDFRKPDKRGQNYIAHGVYNTGPCPLPGGRVMFTSSRNGYRAPKHPAPCLQLFVMDDDGKNVEQVGYLNIGMALHPTVLTDGRVMFSSMESQGLRTGIEWGLWVIRPDGTKWRPLLSAFRPGGGAPNAFHFQTQLGDGSVVAEEYYNQNNSGFGTYYKMPPPPANGYAMGPADPRDERNTPLRIGRFDNGRPKWNRLAFSPAGIESLTRFAWPDDGPADRSIRGDKNSPAVGKFTHPSGAPDGNLLTIYSPGPTNHQYTHLPQLDGGIYLIKGGRPIDEPAQMRLIKNDPNYNEQWPRAVVPYSRIYGVAEPKTISPLKNDGSLSPHLPEGTPFGLVGTSSFYKRESYPRGRVPQGQTAATYAGGKDPYQGLDAFNTTDESYLNWKNQGADAGKYSSDDIHAVRILAMEPTTDNRGGRKFYNHANERLRILGEIPLRKFTGDAQPADPDGNPDTSFLAKIPADTAFTFQTLDRNGMVLNMAQTWHQVRPGEMRTDCGGCHAHSQEPTPFEKTAAARADYELFDLTKSTPLLTTKAADQSKRKWDEDDATGLRFAAGTVQNVEYHRDVEPILRRACASCHDAAAKEPAGDLMLNNDELVSVPNGPKVPATYYALASETDYKVKFGHKPLDKGGQWRFPNASRYVRKFQSRRSLLVWKIYGRRLDGWTNDDFPTETTPGDAGTLAWHGKAVAADQVAKLISIADLDYDGKPCPPTGSGVALNDEERRTIVRWIDLGCPIELDPVAAEPRAAGSKTDLRATYGFGWHCDDNRPTLALTIPTDRRRLVIGAYDYYSGLDESSLTVTASFPLAGKAAGEDLAPLFKPAARDTWRLEGDVPRDGTLSVSVKDRAGNVARIERTLR